MYLKMTEAIDFIWSPHTLRLSVNDLIQSSNDQKLTFGVEFSTRDICSAFLNLTCNGVNAVSLALDLMTTITNLGEEQEGNCTKVFYRYCRCGVDITLEVSSETSDTNDLVTFEYIFSQYSLFFVRTINQIEELDNQGHKPNLFAQGLEGTGIAVRHALKSGGKVLGSTIRLLGSSYTGTAVRVNRAMNKPMGHREVKVQSVETANRRKDQAEDIHAGARTLTGAVLYPVRWTGRKAAELALSGGNNTTSSTSQEESSVKRALLDTVGGLGNAVSSMCKGITEALSEVGTAIGDTAINHSKTINGEEYADNVTQRYIDACSEIGLAGYKIANVASFGVHGVMLDAVVEGTTLLVSLYDYLVGPVLLQGYVDLLQPPLLRPTRYFAVLRPWSISFYACAAGVTGKPVKIIPTAMMDTMPKLRTRDVISPVDIDSEEAIKCSDDGLEYATGSDGNETVQKEEGGRKLPSDHIEDVQTNQKKNYSSFRVCNSNDEIIDYEDENEEDTVFVESFPSASSDNAECCNSSTISRYANRIDSTIQHWRGGERSHIEICTVDCSTYLIYMPTDEEMEGDETCSKRYGASSTSVPLHSSDLLQFWFEELKSSSLRVETIKKRRSGAEEIAIRKRLELLPREFKVVITVRRLVISSSDECLNDLTRQPENRSNSQVVLPFHVDEEGNQYSEVASEAVPPSAQNFENIGAEESQIVNDPSDHCNEDCAQSNNFRGLASAVAVTALAEEDAPSLNHNGTTATTGVKAGDDHSTAASSSSSSSVPSSLTAIRQGFGRLVDPIRDSVVKEARVRVLPVTPCGVKVRAEEQCTNYSTLGAPVLPGNVHYMEANWAAASSQVLSATNCSTNNTLELGNKACLNNSECSFLQIIVEAQTIYNTNVEFGEACIPWDSIHLCENGYCRPRVIVDLISDEVRGSVNEVDDAVFQEICETLDSRPSSHRENIGGSSIDENHNKRKVEVSSSQTEVDPCEKNTEKLSGSSLAETSGNNSSFDSPKFVDVIDEAEDRDVTQWLDVIHKPSGRLVAKLLVDVYQIKSENG